jgi:hypothetical protein
VRRQQERDLGFVMALNEGLSRPQSELFFAVLTFVAGLRADPLLGLTDADVADGAAALAATYETAGRGVIYEHRPASMPAQRFVTDAKAFLARLVAEADAATSRRVERDAPVVFRRLETGVRGAREMAEEGPAAGLEMIARFVTAARTGGPAGETSGRVKEPGRILL